MHIKYYTLTLSLPVLSTSAHDSATELTSLVL